MTPQRILVRAGFASGTERRHRYVAYEKTSKTIASDATRCAFLRRGDIDLAPLVPPETQRYATSNVSYSLRQQLCFKLLSLSFA